MTQNLGLPGFIEPEPFSFPLGSREGSGYENEISCEYFILLKKENHLLNHI